MMFVSNRCTFDARIVSVLPLRDVHAGSALVAHAGRLLVIQDDAASVVWLDPASGKTERVVLEGTGEQLEKAQKPDFEVAFLGPGPVVTIVGSGSSRRRRRRAVLDLATNSVRLFDESRLFDAVELALGGEPNLEGGVIWQNQLRLFHRGSGAQKSVIVDVNLDVLDGAAPRISAAVPIDLGTVNNVPLHFTDATAHEDRIVYVAVAEDTPNAIDDGPVVGAVIGFLEGSEADQAPLRELSGAITTRKVEGLAFDDRTGVLFGVTDPDDPDKPAELLRIEIVRHQSG